MLYSNVKIKKLNENAIIPTYGSEYAAGADLYACLDEAIIIKKGETVFVPTGISIELPEGTAGLLYARSGLASKKGLAPANKVGVVDSDYRGEIIVPVHNDTNNIQYISPDEKIAQLVISEIVYWDMTEVDNLEDTDRGKGGFGSTGKK